MRVSIVTIFPGLFQGVFDYGMIRQARKKDLLQLDLVDLRDFAHDRHRTVDDRPFGGGDGMVLKPEPVYEALQAIQETDQAAPRKALLSPRGRSFDQALAVEYSLLDHLVLVCGRYEGVDQRVADHMVDEEVSIGDYVLSGGEFAALTIVDAVSRLIPGVVSKSGSVLRDSFMDDLLDCPYYTRPAEFRGWKVPDVLLSGDHQAIENWKKREALRLTRERRPDLLKRN
ncbi:MAG TPA: tRNA (guanosine(37)-N1)-methyltransferase TrmD [Acidobacteriota bacterium]|nr:tRNA (guanosine(37)-N1)-methyltransferase TrmD [Acidobacteriota bacterium]